MKLQAAPVTIMTLGVVGVEANVTIILHEA